ncbi:hypothetical protein OROMI_029822 [Orobanche minor]
MMLAISDSRKSPSLISPIGAINAKCVQHLFSLGYKVHVRVEDESGTTSFVLFDHQVSQILGKSASDLKQTLDLAGEDDSFPDELEQLIDKKFSFKLEISNYTLQQRVKMYNVLKMSQDEQIMSKFNDKKTCGSKEINGPCNEIDASTISSICDIKGQLYVVISRVKSRKGLKILCCDENGAIISRTNNVVYKEALQNL